MMTTAQSTAFEEGTGSFFTAADFLLVIQSIGATLIFYMWRGLSFEHTTTLVKNLLNHEIW
jgi:hypothetical protein